MSAPRDEALRQSAAMGRVQELAHAHGTGGDADADAQQAIFVALLAYAGEERDALGRVLVDEYADVVARRGAWEQPAILGQAEQYCYLHGVYAALDRVAARLGVTDLHEQAAEVVARGERDG